MPPTIRLFRKGPCAADGCDRDTRRGGLGYCGMHYQRLKKTGSLAQPARTAPLRDRFAAMISDAPCSCGCGCILWTGGINTYGYGNFSIGNKSHAAHRLAYEFAAGPIPDDLQIDHVYERGCRHRNCVNLDHLEAVTVKINNQRVPVTPARRERLAAAGRKGAATRWGSAVQ